ncbi:MAG: hypothetical protein ACYTGV_16090, partial [Planctomycetota bacterium]
MGDRANVVMVDKGWDGDEPPKFVYLYTHWGGYELPLVVKKVLQRKARWNDPAYLARMIFCAMIPAGQEDGETGFGIGSSRPDNEHPYILVDSREQRIGFTPEGMEPNADVWWSFEDFIAMSDDEIT